jgi:hypothetical protein
VHTQGLTWVTDYLVGCHSSDTSGFSVFVGSHEGDVALLRNANYADRASPWTLEKLFVRGHSGVVRSLLWDETVRWHAHLSITLLWLNDILTRAE